MGWEVRGNRRYYTRSRKVNGRVIREYVGGGIVGLAAEREDQQRRQRAEDARALLRQDRETFDAAATPHRRLDTLGDALMRAALTNAGYHQPNRSAWRKRRGA